MKNIINTETTLNKIECLLEQKFNLEELNFNKFKICFPNGKIFKLKANSIIYAISETYQYNTNELNYLIACYNKILSMYDTYSKLKELKDSKEHYFISYKNLGRRFNNILDFNNSYDLYDLEILKDALEQIKSEHTDYSESLPF